MLGLHLRVLRLQLAELFGHVLQLTKVLLLDFRSKLRLLGALLERVNLVLQLSDTRLQLLVILLEQVIVRSAALVIKIGKFSGKHFFLFLQRIDDFLVLVFAILLLQLVELSDMVVVK